MCSILDLRIVPEFPEDEPVLANTVKIFAPPYQSRAASVSARASVS